MKGKGKLTQVSKLTQVHIVELGRVSENRPGNTRNLAVGAERTSRDKGTDILLEGGPPEMLRNKIG